MSTEEAPSPMPAVTAIVIASRNRSHAVVAGVPLLVRAVLSAQRAGITTILVQHDENPRGVREVLDRDPRTRGVEIVATEEIAARRDTGVILIAGDCLVTARTLKAVAESTTGTQIIGVRAEPPPTPVLVKEGKPGTRSPLTKGRPQGGPRDGVDTPFAIVAGPRARWLDIWALMTGGTMHGMVTEREHDCVLRVRDDADVLSAEAALVAELRAATVDTDGPIARLDRAVSTRLSRWLVRTPLRPNHITVIGTCAGLVAAWALAQGSYAYGLLGAWLFWIAVIVDGCDGEVARLKFLESRFGHLFDVITDNVVHVAIFAGVALGAYRAGRIEHVILFGTTLITGFLCASAATYFCLLNDGPVKHLETSSPDSRIRRRLLQIFETLMNRDFAYLLAVLALVDRMHWFLWGTVFGTYAYALGLVWVYRWNDGAAPAPQSSEPAVDSPG